MKKSIFLLLTLALLLGVLGVFSIVANADEVEPQMSIAYCNLSFRDTVCIKYAVASNVSDVKILIWTSPEADYTVGTHDSEITDYYTENIGGTPHMVFDYTELSAKQMTDVVYARAYTQVDGVDYYSQVNKYSILQYAQNKLATSTDAKLKALLSNMLIYGASAQEYFNYNADRLPTANWYQIKVTAGRLDDGMDHGLYLSGDKVTLTAPETDAEGKVFAYWGDENGDTIATTATYELTVGTANAVYTPMYKHTDDAAALLEAVVVYTIKLQEMKIDFELNKADYLAADYEAVVTAIANAITAIADAETVEGVEKIFNDAKAVYDTTKAGYDTKAPVITKLIGYYNAVRNAITVDSKALIDEIDVYVNGNATTPSVVSTVYPTTDDLPPAVTAYKNGDKKPDGTDVTINLVTELNAAIAAYNYLVNPTAGLKADATAATNAIKAIGTVKFGISDAAIANARTAYNDFAAKVTGRTGVAAYLADSNLDMVENRAVLPAAQARQVELAVAAAMFDTYGTQSATGIASIFAAYNALADKTLYTNKAVYDAVDATLNKWIADYKLEAENVALIVDAKEGINFFYYNYTLNKHTTELSAKAYTDFAAIVSRIEALNKLTTVTVADVTEYGEITKAIDAWQTLQSADTSAIPQTIYTMKITISDANKAAILAAYGLTGAIDKASNNFALYNFVNADVEAFFQNNYSTIEAQAKVINDAIKNLKNNIDNSYSKYPTIQRYIELKGEYAYDETSKTWTKVATPSDVTTIAGFLETYKAHDLASLLNIADYEAALAKAVARIDGFKAGAATIKTLVEAIDYTAVIKVSDVEYRIPTQAQLESGDYYCYVNLSDADAVAKANDAYAAWIMTGASTNLKEWVPAVDEDGEVIKDIYVFQPIADTLVISQLTQMNNDINELKDMAAKLVAHFELVAEIWNQNKAFALNATAEQNTADTKVLTLVPAVLDAGVVNKVSYAYPVTLSTAAANTFSFNGVSYNFAAKGAMVETTSLTAVATLQDLITAGYDAYQAFLSMNAEIKLKTSNGALVLDSVKAVKDSSVENAIKDIAAAELVMLKDYAKDFINSSSIGASDKLTFCGFVDTLVTSVSGNGSQLYNIAVEFFARFNLKMSALNRGYAVTVTICHADGTTKTFKNVSDYTQVFRAPIYNNLEKSIG